MLDYTKGGNKKGGSDPADAATEKILKNIEDQITKEYAQAEKEIKQKLDDYLRRFQVKDELKRKALANGLISENEYKQWRIGQIMMGKRWEEMRDSIAKDLTNADQIARSIAFGHMPEVYAINHDYGTFQIEKASLLDTSYTLYDRQAMEQLMKDNDQTFIPAPGRKVTQAINEGKAMAWNRKQVQSAMMQSLLQGESIPDIATRLAKTVGESDRKAAIRNARTMTTGIENAGRMASYKRANDMGIETQKQWLATLDSRTRHWHSSLDGVKVDNDKPFTNEYGDIMYPGDPAADPSNIFNCRCTLIASIKGFERDVSDMDLRHDDNLGDMTYDEWRAGKYDQTSDSITKQDDIAHIMEQSYINDYRAIAGQNPIWSSEVSAEEVEPLLEKVMEESKINVVNNREEAYNNLTTLFGSVEDTNAIDAGLLVDNVNRLNELNERFKVLDSGNIGRCTFNSNGKAGKLGDKAWVITPHNRKSEYSLNLSPNFFANPKVLETKFFAERTSGFKMPALDEYSRTYTITHEYGHMLAEYIAKRRQKWGGRLGDDYVDDPKKEYKKIINKMTKEIIKIADKNNPNFSLGANLSTYGFDNNDDMFAEIFANSQCGAPNELGKAMIEWLEKEGF